jgi:Regulator of Chromosome Condensation (RCC1) repeat protein
MRTLSVTALVLVACSSGRGGEEVAAPKVGGAPPATAEAPGLPPAPVPRAAGRLAMGHYRACLARDDASVVCWGEWVFGEGSGVVPEPTVVPGLTDVDQVSGDDQGWCARKKDGEVVCWDEPDRKLKSHAHGATDISGTCAILEDHTVACADETGMKRIAGIADARQIASDSSVTSGYVVLRDGSVKCWGFSYFQARKLCTGTLLPEGAPDPTEPFVVPGVTGVEQIDNNGWVGGVCSVSGGKVTCWAGEHGGTPAVEESSHVVQVAVAEYHACMLLGDGTVRCTGANYSGQIGTGGTGEGGDAVVPGVSDVVEVRVGSGEPCGGCGSTCVLQRSGEVLCWGGINGQTSPTPVAGANGALSH